LTDDYFICPCCGAELPVTARFCRHCGASDDSGWNADEHVPDDGSDFDPDDDFDYDDFLRRELPEHASQGPGSSPSRILAGAIVILLCLLLLLMALWPF
jgi:hypothetical protein